MEKPEKTTMTFQELANYYCVNSRTLQNWVKDIRQELLDMYPMKQSRLTILIPKQLKRIKQLLE